MKVFNPFVTSPSAEEVYASDEAIARARAAALRKLERSSGAQPIQHWLQGAAQMTEAAMGGLQYQRAESQEQQKRQALAAALTGLFGGGDASGAAGAPVQPAGGGAPAMPGAAPAAGPSPSAGAPPGGGVDMRRLATIYALNPELGARIAMSEMEKMEARRKAAMPQPIKGENGSIGVYDPTTQSYRNIYTPPAGPQKVGVNERLVQDGNVIVDAVKPEKARPMTPEEKAAAGIPAEVSAIVKPDGTVDVVNTGVLPPAAQAQKIEQAQAGRSNQSVTLNNGPNELVGGVMKQFNESRDAASGAAASINSIHDARRQLDTAGGIVSGAGAESLLQLRKVGQLLGVGDPAAITNTETFRAQVAPIVLGAIKGLGAGSAISNADREFIEKAVGGNISLDDTSIRRILDIQERALRSKIDRHNKQAESLLADPNFSAQPGVQAIRPLLSVGMPDEYKRPEAPAAAQPTAPAGPVAPPGTPMPAQPMPAPAPAPPAQSDMRAPPATPKAPGRAPAQAQPTQPAQGGAASNLPRITTEEQYRWLPQGAEYIDPEGNRRTKGGSR